MTKQRELILNILKQSDRHLTADEIFFLAKLKMPSIAMATIYNNLNALHEAGVINRLHIDGVADCFDKIIAPHDHLLCDRCGKITDIHLPRLTEELERELATEIENYELTVHYVCPECRRAPKRRASAE
jgi:Fe2+ or Zn2+ uptake regulation protein